MEKIKRHVASSLTKAPLWAQFWATQIKPSCSRRRLSKMIGWAGRGTGNDCRVVPLRRNALNDDGLRPIEGNLCPPTGPLLRLCPSRRIRPQLDGGTIADDPVGIFGLGDFVVSRIRQ